METLKSSKAVAIVTTALFVGSLVWLMTTKSANTSLETGLQKEKLKTEELLSEKLLLEKDIQKTKDRLLSMQGKNSELDNLLQDALTRLQAQEGEFSRLKRENASVAKIRKQREELIALQSQLENELHTLRSSYARLEAENRELSNAVASLQERNSILTNDLNRARFASVDHSQVQAVKGKKEKLTVSAKRARKLVAQFEVPARLKNFSFRILDSKGIPLPAKDGTIGTTITPSEKNFSASASSEAQETELQNVQMTYIPRQKLRSGVYTVEILNDNLYVGSLKVKLK